MTIELEMGFVWRLVADGEPELAEVFDEDLWHRPEALVCMETAGRRLLSAGPRYQRRQTPSRDYVAVMEGIGRKMIRNVNAKRFEERQ